MDAPAFAKTIESMISVGGHLGDIGGCEGAAGNLSTDLGAIDPASLGWDPLAEFPLELSLPSLAGNVFLFTASGARLRSLGGERSFVLARVGDGGTSLRVHGPNRDDPLEPTSEHLCHLAAYAVRKEMGWRIRHILHTQPYHLTALTHLEDLAEPATFNRALFRWQAETILAVPDGVGLAPWRLPGSSALAEETASLARRHGFILWRKHGLIALGNDWDAMLDRVDYLEIAGRYCLELRERAAGLTPGEIRKICDRFGIHNPYLRGMDED